MNAPKVSITMPTYNGMRYIQEAINSVLTQSFTDFELVIVIDGSSDGTELFLQSINDARVRIHKKSVNGGLPAALNTGLDLSRGEYWCWIADDDLYVEGTLQELVDYMDDHPKVAIVSPYICHISPDGARSQLRKTDWCCFLCRNSAAQKIRFRPEYMLVEDADFFLRMEYAYGPAGRVEKPLYLFRDHPSSLSSTQIQKRQYISTLMHYDLITRGIENSSLEELFFDRVKMAAFYKGYDWMDKIVAFAEEKKMPFARKLHKRAQLLRKKWMWFLLKINIAIGSRVKQVIYHFKHESK